MGSLHLPSGSDRKSYPAGSAATRPQPIPGDIISSILGTFVVVDIGESLLRPLDQSGESPRSRCPSGSESAIRGGL